jgi:MFS family permease
MNAYRDLWRRNHQWRWLLASIGVSAPGDLLYSVALAAELYRRTHNAGWLSAVAIVGPLGRMLLAPVGGDMADRFNRRNIVLGTNIIRALIMTVLGFLILVDAPPLLLVGCVLLSALSYAPQRAAFVAMVPEIVDRDDLATANAADAVVSQTAWMIGPAIGAAVMVTLGPTVAMIANALTFVAAAVCTSRLRPTTPRFDESANDTAIESDMDSTRFFERVAVGFTTVKQSPALRAVTWLLAGSLLVFGAEEVLTVLFATDRLRLGNGGAGYLLTAIGVGGLLAAPLVTRFNPSGSSLGPVIVGTGTLLSMPLCVLAFTHSPVIALAVMGMEGAGTLVFETVMMTVTQLESDDAVLGRVSGLQEFTAGAAQLLGAAAAPILIAITGLTPSALMFATIAALLAVVAARIVSTNASRDPIVLAQQQIQRTHTD